MGMTPGRAAVTVSILLGATLSCASTGAPAAAPPEVEQRQRRPAGADRETAEDASSRDQPAPAAQQPAATRVHVEKVGDEPRVALRQHFTAGTRQVQRIHGETRVTTARTQRLMTLEGRRTVSITDVAPDGSAQFVVDVGPLTLTSDEQDPGSGASRDSTSAAAHSEGEVDVCGVWISHRIRVDAAAPGALALTAKSLAQASDPLPPEEVGPGGVWVATQTLEDPDGPVEQVTTYTLAEANDSAFRAQVVRVQQAAAGGEPATESRGELFQQLDWLFPDQDLEQNTVATTPDGQRIEVRARIQLQTE